MATYRNMGRNCDACMFLKDINTLDNLPRKTLKITKLVMYWQSLPMEEVGRFAIDFFLLLKPRNLCFGKLSLWEDYNIDIKYVFF